MPKQILYPRRTTDYKKIQARIFIQDPLVSTRRSGQLATIKLPGEPFLGAGPASSRVEVVDFDEGINQTHPPAQPLASRDGFAVGRGKPINNVKHHQVNVWAIITRTLNILEDPSVLGRPIPWAFGSGRLRVWPHHHEEENAYYDRDLGGIQFCYFRGRKGVVQSCLSHDIITHELGHAVLDGLKPHYYERENPDLAGFHEYFGDAIAMASSLTMEAVLADVVRDHPRRLGAKNLVSDMALEFGSMGEYGEDHVPLRSAANRVTMDKLRGNWEEHDYSEVLMGAYYDLLCRLYRDAIPRNLEYFNKRKVDGQVAIASLISAARRTGRMMLRALDYCPPAGLTYLDYARAVLRADQVAYPVDDRGYREMAYQVMLRRGLFKSRSNAKPEFQLKNSDFREYDVDLLSATRTQAYSFLDANRETLRIPRDANFEVLSLYRTRKVSAERYYPPREIVIEFGWPVSLPLEGRAYGKLAGEAYALWCGGTLVFDSDGNVLHYVVKLADAARIARCLAYVRYCVQNKILGDEDGAELRIRRTDRGISFVCVPAMRHKGRRGEGRVARAAKPRSDVRRRGAARQR